MLFRNPHPRRMFVVNPVPFGWSEVGDTLFYRFEEAPPSGGLLRWAHTEEVAERQERANRVWPRYVVVLVPDETELFLYADELEEFNNLCLGVGLAGDEGTLEAWINACNACKV